MRSHRNVSTGILIGAVLCVFFSSSVAYAATPYYKNQVGLNVHWALGGFGHDEAYAAKLHTSNTAWVREHFYTEVLWPLETCGAWCERYTDVLEEYRAQGIGVVGMIGYRETHGDFHAPYPDEWQAYVKRLVTQYRPYVHHWEVWNEPDSPDYLTPNSPQAFGEILRMTYGAIKEADPGATVIAGGLAAPNVDFAEVVARDYSDSFDIFGLHLYYFSEWKNLGNVDRMVSDTKRLVDQIGDKKIWITELGATTGNTALTERDVQQYLADAVPAILTLPSVQKVFLYTFRDRDISDTYEKEFGLLHLDMSAKPAWKWYSDIYRGPYRKPVMPSATVIPLTKTLRTELEKYFGKELALDVEDWRVLAEAYVYGDYPVQAIAQAIRFSGHTVHPLIPWREWKTTADYQAYISKGWTGKKFVYAYGKTRISITTEQQKARELKEALATRFPGKQLGIDANNWLTVVRAYVYGGYPVEAIARAIRYGGKTVHPAIPWTQWKTQADYLAYIQKPL